MSNLYIKHDSQITNLNLLFNLIKLLIIVSIILNILIFVLSLDISSFEFSLFLGYLKAKLNIFDKITFNYYGKDYILSNSDFIEYAKNQFIGLKTINKIWLSFLYSLSAYLLIPAYILYLKANSNFDDKYIRGSKIVSPKVIIDMNKKYNPDLPFGGIVKVVGFDKSTDTEIRIYKYIIQLARASETNNVFFIGSPGSGKTVFLNKVIKRIIERGDRSIIYDTKGNYIANFYREGKDYIFDPTDKRCVSWNLFNDIPNKTYVDSICKSLVPETTGENVYWHNAARDLMISILRYCIEKNKKTHRDIWKLLKMDIKELAETLKEVEGTEIGVSHISSKNGDQAQIVKSVLMQYAKAFELLENINGNFSIKNWLTNNTGDNLFIKNLPKTKAVLTPIISLFIDIIGSYALSMPDDLNRRLFFFLDEFGSLHQMQSIISLLTAGRSKGVSLWVGTQDIGQLEKIYGNQLRQTIINSCSSSLIFKVADQTAAKYLSENLGQALYKKKRENYSIGVSATKDGMNISHEEKLEYIVLPSELQNLPKLRAYVKLDNCPVTKVDFAIEKYPIIAEEHIDRDEFALNSRSAVLQSNVSKSNYIGIKMANTIEDVSIKDVPVVEVSQSSDSSQIDYDNNIINVQY